MTRWPPDEPADIPAEQAALGAILQCPPLASRALPLLAPDDFVRPWHRHLVRVLQQMHRDGQPIDPLTAHHELLQRGSRGDGASSPGVLLADLVAAPPLLANGMSYVGIVLEHSARRRLHQAGVRLVQLAGDGHGDLVEVMRLVNREVTEIRERTAAVQRAQSSGRAAAPARDEAAAVSNDRSLGRIR